jgi:hypothetical protein
MFDFNTARPGHIGVRLLSNGTPEVFNSFIQFLGQYL